MEIYCTLEVQKVQAFILFSKTQTLLATSRGLKIMRDHTAQVQEQIQNWKHL